MRPVISFTFKRCVVSLNSYSWNAQVNAEYEQPELGQKLKNFGHKKHHRKVQIYFWQRQNRKFQVIVVWVGIILKRDFQNGNMDNIKFPFYLTNACILQGRVCSMEVSGCLGAVRVRCNCIGSHWSSPLHAFVSCMRW